LATRALISDISDWKPLRRSARAIVWTGLIACPDPSVGVSRDAGFGSPPARVSAINASMSESGMSDIGSMPVMGRDASAVSIGVIVADVATVLSASGFLPVTDWTNAIVCAIRRSRSLIQFMRHLDPTNTTKWLLWNQGPAGDLERDNIDFARGVTKL